jgi:hypothetical protein
MTVWAAQRGLRKASRAVGAAEEETTVRSSDLTDVASAELRARNDRAAILHRSWTKTMRAQVDDLDDAGSTAPANELELHVDEWSISMHGPAAMVLATRIAQKRSALHNVESPVARYQKARERNISPQARATRPEREYYL